MQTTKEEENNSTRPRIFRRIKPELEESATQQHINDMLDTYGNVDFIQEVLDEFFLDWLYTGMYNIQDKNNLVDTAAVYIHLSRIVQSMEQTLKEVPQD